MQKDGGDQNKELATEGRHKERNAPYRGGLSRLYAFPRAQTMFLS